MTDELWTRSALELAALVRTREVSPVELVDVVLRRIEERNARTNAFVTLVPERAAAAAREAERAVLAGESLGSLHGVPIAIKDLEATAGVRTTFGMTAFRDHVPDETAVCVERLLGGGAGAIMVGKTNAPELGHKSITDNALFGPTSTPFAQGMNAGGSSGGSAAAVGDGLVPIAQGGDGGGSIRIPAALCGVYGLKPSFGRVPIAAAPNAYLAPPFVGMGPLTRTVADAAAMLDAMSGPDPRDPFALPAAALGLADALDAPLAGLRVAYSRDLDVFDVDADVAAVCEQAVAALAAAGATVEQVTLGLTRSQEEYRVTWQGEIAVKNANAFAAMRAAGVDLDAPENRPTPYLRAAAERGEAMRAVDYDAIGILKSEVFHAIERVFADHDLLVSPTCAVGGVANPAPGSLTGPDALLDAVANPLVGRTLAYFFNMTGHPAASAPAGLTPAGLPVGLQIVGPRWREDLVVQASAGLERVRPWVHLYRD
ncbi:MAG TPA: amidase family protein [Conexibacter sp.]|jgi:aspartyl-tRNA(Asn)/glutamyl-tRNA(Gln) amidotransferase subunit A|nr:amidase family protein [Conexibacter sp.]